ncbi:MAG: ABC transporter permease subunit, partial [Planctomycetes bacterium]|nr:ABC transporter permease subunit [Planctomycetota bacterium]
IFDKELRVSSHRRRTYVMRVAYLALLTLFVVLVWLALVRDFSGLSPAYRISRMSEAGKTIVAVIVGFQFIAGQMVLVVLMSTSISDEIYHGTLGILMTTPINGFQIVMGKLLSKLLQLVILLAVSVPVLAIVRVFGGVPWDFVLAGVCITLCTAVFLGAVAMYFSIYTRRAYSVLLKTIALAAGLFLVVPIVLVALLICHAQMTPTSPLFMSVMGFLHNTNPYMGLGLSTGAVLNPQGMGMLPAFSWPLLCGVLLACSVVVLAVCVRVVRKVALRQATGEAGLFVTRRKRKTASPAQRKADGRIRRVRGWPVAWREMRTPLLGKGKVGSVIGVILLAIGLGAVYFSLGYVDALHDDDTHMAFVLIYFLLAMPVTAVLSATPITTERECRTWSILLATTLSDGRILLGKAIGVWRRCLPVWALLAGHVIVFTLVGYINAILSLHLLIIATWVVLFFTGTGLYFSARLKRTTSAVLANVGLGLALWALAPLVMTLVCEIGRFHSTDLFETSFAHPVVQVVVVAEGAFHDNHYRWPSAHGVGILGTTVVLFANLLGYGMAAGVFALRARKWMRKRVF